METLTAENHLNYCEIDLNDASVIDSYVEVSLIVTESVKIADDLSFSQVIGTFSVGDKQWNLRLHVDTASVLEEGSTLTAPIEVPISYCVATDTKKGVYEPIADFTTQEEITLPVLGYQI